MKFLCLCITLLLQSQIGFSQKSITALNTIEKSVLLIKNYNEIVNLKKEKPTTQSIKNGISVTKIDRSGDHYTFSFASYPKEKSLSSEILSTTNFISRDININTYLTFFINTLGKKRGEFDNETVRIDVSKLPKSDTYFQIKDIPKTLQIWEINAQWDEYLVSDDNNSSTYYVLKSIKSAKPIYSNLNDKLVEIIK